MTCSWEIYEGDALEQLALMDSGCVQTCITSPPYYGLRDYGQDGQLGLEATPTAYVDSLVAVFAEVRRVLRDDGTLWLNLGDSYCSALGNPSSNSSDGKPPARRGWTRPQDWPMVGYKPKDLIGIPWMVAFALRADGWYLRSEIIWSKPNPMPESVTDRPTKAHEQVFLLAKSRFYFYDANAISEVAQYAGDDRRARTDNTVAQRIGYKSQTERSEPTNERRNKRSVWEITTQPYAEAHFATFPTKLVEPMVLAGSPYGSLVLDPFAGAGTTLKVAVGLGRSAIGIELNPEYATMARRRLAGVTPAMF